MEEMRALLDVCSVSPSGIHKEQRVMRFSDVTPNLVVSNVERSLAFYRDVLGFSVFTTVPPETGPFAFAWMKRDDVSVFLNSVESVKAEHAELGAKPIGGTASLFIVLEAGAIAEGVDAMFAAIGGRARVLMELKDQFYGMREFAIEDPDGYLIIFAQALPK
jgi:uncharacterized glyoxalase superfamily protein PhnB